MKMQAIPIKEGVYWVGAVDWSLRLFHGYTTDLGATYNAYLIIDDKITLIDTAKAPFAGELLARVAEVVDPADIDYLIANHVETDHSGSLPAVLARCPKAQVVASAPHGVRGLTLHYGDRGYLPVQAGDTLNIGRRNLVFVPTPMVHWPDNMVTYCPEEKILFSNDAFGQHFTSAQRFDDQAPLDLVMREARKYFANIVMPYWKQAAGALKAAQSLELELVAPSHGVIWRSHIRDIFAAYGQWTGGGCGNGALVVFDSMWHATETIARSIAEAFGEKGLPVHYFDLKTTHMSDIVPEVLDSQYIAVGSPTLNNGMLPTVAAFLCYLKGLSPKGRKAFAFGSYGWSGQSVGLVEEELQKCGFEICLPMTRLQYIPTEAQLAALRQAVLSL